MAIEIKQLRVLLFSVGVLPEGDTLRLADLAVACAVASQPAHFSEDLARRVLAPLSPALRVTARKFLQQDLSVASAAKALNTHRNTLVQRLDRITRLTGLGLRRFHHASTMQLALLAADSMADRPD